MRRIYEGVSPGLLLLTGWLLLLLAMIIRIKQDLEIPWLNGIFILLGLAAFYLPLKYAEEGSGSHLRRKLLWMLVLAGALVLIWESVGFPKISVGK